MVWAVVYAATIFAIAYVIPKVLFISAQMKVFERQLSDLAEASMGASPDVPPPDIGGYA